MIRAITAAILFLCAATSEAAQAHFQIEGMATDACEKEVTRLLTGIAGVTKVEVHRKSGLARVTHSGGGLTDDALAERISKPRGKHPPHRAVPISATTAKSRFDQHLSEERKKAQSAIKPEGPLNPWDPIDETFRGCEGGCGTRGEDSRAVMQPGAKVGDRAYCPVSGVVFQINESTLKADVNGRAIYFCCEGCARHFGVAREEVLSKRRM